MTFYFLNYAQDFLIKCLSTCTRSNKIMLNIALKFEGEELKISSRSGSKFSEHIYGSMKKDDLESLKSKIQIDIKRFGGLAKRKYDGHL